MVLVILLSDYQKTLQFDVNRKAFVSFSDFREYTKPFSSMDSPVHSPTHFFSLYK